MLIHRSLQLLAVAPLADAAKVAGVRQLQQFLDGLLDHHEAAHQEQRGHDPAAGVDQLGVLIAKAKRAEGDQHHPVAIAPVPALDQPVTDCTGIDHGGEGQDWSRPRALAHQRANRAEQAASARQ